MAESSVIVELFCHYCMNTNMNLYRNDHMPRSTPKAYKYVLTLPASKFGEIREEILGSRLRGNRHIERDLDCRIHDRFFDTVSYIAFRRQRDKVMFMLRYL